MVWLVSIGIGTALGLLNALYWKRDGHPFWRTFYFSSILGFGLCLAVYKFFFK